MEKVCVFCSSSDVVEQIYKSEAQKLGEILANESITLVYGGAKVGMMGIIAKTMIDQQGHVIGVIPELINNHNLAENSVSELIVTEDMKSRKAKMADLADAFIALPGGFGTLEELVEVITLKQLGYHHKPIVIVNTNGFYDGLLEFMHHSIAERFMGSNHLKMWSVVDEPEDVLDAINGSEQWDSSALQFANVTAANA